MTPKIKVLILAANPPGWVQLQFDREVREIERRLEKQAGLFEIHAVLAATQDDLESKVLAERPHIVHFVGHGENGCLVFDDEDNQEQIVAPGALQTMWQEGGVKLVMLNACYSSQQAELIHQTVPHVVGLEIAAEDSAARKFAGAFYQGLAHTRNVAAAFRLGKESLQGADLLEDVQPVLVSTAKVATSLVDAWVHPLSDPENQTDFISLLKEVEERADNPPLDWKNLLLSAKEGTFADRTLRINSLYQVAELLWQKDLDGMHGSLVRFIRKLQKRVPIMHNRLDEWLTQAKQCHSLIFAEDLPAELEEFSADRLLVEVDILGTTQAGEANKYTIRFYHATQDGQAVRLLDFTNASVHQLGKKIIDIINDSNQPIDAFKRIEFFLPVELLTTEKVDLIEDPPFENEDAYWLAEDHAIVIRSWERARNGLKPKRRRKTFRNRWEKRWEKITNQSETPLNFWHLGNENELLDLLEMDQVVSVGFCTLPSEDELFLAIKEGIPVMFWSRLAREDSYPPEKLQAQLTDRLLLKDHPECDWVAIEQHVGKERKVAAKKRRFRFKRKQVDHDQNEDDPITHVALFWDDPYCTLPKD